MIIVCRYCGKIRSAHDTSATKIIGVCKTGRCFQIHQRYPKLGFVLAAAQARVVESVDTRDLKSLGASHAGSSPAARTTNRRQGNVVPRNRSGMGNESAA